MIPIDADGDGTGARYAGSVREKSKANGHCNICGGILLGIRFTHECRIAHVCDNFLCTIFASPQSYAQIPAAQLRARRPALIAFTKPSYSSYLITKKHNYRRLRHLGVDAVEASHMASNKQTKAYVESKGLVY